jgi:hypothetical protein
MCLTYFIDWKYIHSWLVFLTLLVNCCPHERRNYTCVLLPLYLLSDLPPTVYTDSVWLCGEGWVGGGGGGGVFNYVVDPICRSLTLCF